MSGDRLIQTRSWYYMNVTADPKNADVVWVMNAPVMRSIDGGATFANVPATHGDNHQLWINPTNPSYLINANDGGASVSLDGGRSWSAQDNQPTAQFYHVTVDDDFPYKLYSGQQDNSSVVIRSRGVAGSVSVRDWWDGAGCESANIGVSAKAPHFVYGGCYQGIIDELDQRTWTSRAIMPWPEMNLTERTDSTRYRFNWTAPILVSQHDANVIYHGGNVLFRTTDRGTTWAPLAGGRTSAATTRRGRGGGRADHERGGRRRGVRHDRRDPRVDARRADALRGDRRRARAAHAGRRRDLDQRHAARRGRWARERDRDLPSIRRRCGSPSGAIAWGIPRPSSTSRPTTARRGRSA